MNTIIVNGKKIISGRNITVIGNKVFVNGEDVTPDAKEINISVEGGLDKLEVEYASKISVTGDVGNIKSTSADVEVTGDVKGSIQTMSGDVDCGDVTGSVSTMSGNVKYKK